MCVLGWVLEVGRVNGCGGVECVGLVGAGEGRATCVSNDVAFMPVHVGEGLCTVSP